MDNMQIELTDLQEKQMTREEQKQWVHERLNSLQSWDLEEGQTIEQRRAVHNEMLIGKELKENEQLRDKWMQTKLSLHAQKVAEGRPAQIQKPAKKTFKQKREDARLDEVAKQRTPVADHVSMHMVESLREYQDQRDNSFAMITEEQKTQAAAQHVDLRILHIYMHGYKKNAAGEPLDEEQQEYKEQDQNFIEGYLSLDVQSRKPHLDRMVDQVLRINISDDMMTEEYMETHAGEMQQQINRMVMFQNVMNDPVNAGYFEALPQSTRQLLERRVIDRYAVYGAVMARICSIKAVDPDAGHIVPEIAEPNHVELLKQTLAGEREMMKETIAQSRKQEREMIENEYARLSDAERQRLLEGDREKKQMIKEEHLRTDKGADLSGLGLTGFSVGYTMETLANYRKLIEDHPEEYRRHALLIDALYQELYRSLDSYSDLMLKAMTAQGVIDELNFRNYYKGEAKDVFMRKAKIDLYEATASSEVVQLQVNAAADAMTCLFEDIPMNQSAAEVVHRLGY